jgi:hypothetical protein
MSSNCLISVFSCCSRKKREIAPLDITSVAGHLQSTGTQIHPETGSPLPSLRLSDRVSHKPTIMVRSGNSFQSQSSDDFSKLSIKNSPIFPNRDQSNFFFIKEKGYKDWNLNSFTHRKSLPKLNPATPGRGLACRLPEIKRKDSLRVGEIEEIENE